MPQSEVRLVINSLEHLDRILVYTPEQKLSPNRGLLMSRAFLYCTSYPQSRGCGPCLRFALHTLGVGGGGGPRLRFALHTLGVGGRGVGPASNLHLSVDVVLVAPLTSASAGEASASSDSTSISRVEVRRVSSSQK